MSWLTPHGRISFKIIAAVLGVLAVLLAALVVAAICLVVRGEAYNLPRVPPRTSE